MAQGVHGHWLRVSPDKRAIAFVEPDHYARDAELWAWIGMKENAEEELRLPPWVNHLAGWEREDIRVRLNP